MMAKRGFNVDLVLELQVDEKKLEDRITGRRIYKDRSYHLKFNPPKEEGKDDVTGEPLIHRSDDTKEAFVRRMHNYKLITVPLTKFYNNKKVLSVVKDALTIKEVAS